MPFKVESAVRSCAGTLGTQRGDEAMGTVWSYLDATPLGRQEDWEDSPEGYLQTERYKWWRWHDAYGNEDKKWTNVVDNASVILNL